MNAKLAMAIFQSGLSPRLRLTAGVLALFYADERGESVYPSIRRIAWLTGKRERQARADVTALVDCGVFVKLTPRNGGRRRSTHYRIDANALPVPKTTWQANIPGIFLPGMSEINTAENNRVTQLNTAENCRDADEHPAVFNTKPGSFSHETRQFSTQNPAENCRRSLREVQEEDQENRTAAQTPRSKQQLTGEPNRGNLAVITRLAREILEQNPGVFKSATDPEFIETTKRACADKNIDYGRHPDVQRDVAHRACAAAWHLTTDEWAKTKAKCTGVRVEQAS